MNTILILLSITCIILFQLYLEKKYKLKLEEWKASHEKEIRQDAVKRSKYVTTGKTVEHFSPFLREFPWSHEDARFIGSPIDLIVFNGLSSDKVEEVIFVEVKTGKSSLTARERSLRDAIKEGRFKWEIIRCEPEKVEEEPQCCSTSK
jgi:predicted Holliday junction resolvase-like endonuclease